MSTTKEKIDDSLLSNSIRKLDSAKYKDTVDLGKEHKKGDKEAKEKSNYGTAPIEDKGVEGSVKNKKEALFGAEKQKELLKKGIERLVKL